jgi:FkbM family methyltransferase
MVMYRLKRTVRQPIIWQRRRQLARAGTPRPPLLEQHMYSQAALDLSVVTAIDPDAIHRVDLDGSSVVWDVGAYRGNGAARLHRLYGGRVYGFEPSPEAYEHMVERFADEPEIVPLPYGLAAADEEHPLKIGGPGSSIYGGHFGDSDTVPVQIHDVVGAMDELGAERIDLMKINIEGAEYDLLDRMLDTHAVERVRYLLIQFHEWHPKAHARRRRIRRRLSVTHEQVWNYDWLWELWCSRSEPHPPPPPDAEERFRAALEARARGPAANSADGPPPSPA